ncbi:hypothetical protein FOPE_08960 [Fonsecaea pedrosoi]|nr:hypothetical protein FOPE_08960 [Fonsecaea pedrosoi]
MPSHPAKRRNSFLSPQQEPSVKKAALLTHQSWEEEFFDDTDIPSDTYRAWVSDDEETPLRFQSTLRLIRPLNDPPLGASAQVWLAVSDLGAFAVKLFTPYTDEDAAAQAERLPYPKPSIQKVLHDCHPFVLETRAYERIRKSCLPSQRFFFLRYYGIVDSPLLPPPYQRRARPWVREGIVLEYLTPGQRSGRLYADNRSDRARTYLESLQAEFVCLDLSKIEKRWYLSVLGDRIRMITALNGLGISHGDVKPDCFGLPDSPHDIALYDLGHSYTFTPDRPCITNGTRRLRPLKLAEKVDCRNAQHTVLKM